MSWDDVCYPPSALCDLYREVHWSTLCTWYVQHSQEFHTRVQYMCDQKVGVPKSWLRWPTALYPLPATPQPRITEFWSVHEPRNHEIALREGVYFLPNRRRSIVFRVLFQPKTLKLKTQTNKTNKEVGDFQDDCAAVRRLGNWGCSKKSLKNKLVNRSSDKQSKSVTVRP